MVAHITTLWVNQNIPGNKASKNKLKIDNITNMPQKQLLYNVTVRGDTQL